MKAIIIDGYHFRSVIELPEIMPTVRLLENYEISVQQQAIPPEYPETRYREYRLALSSIDREIALYSEKGDSIALIRSMTWFAQERIHYPKYKEPPLYMWPSCGQAEKP